MNVLVAVDSFKGSLTSMEAGNAIKEGIQKADPSCLVEVSPLADGGEGTVEALAYATGGRLVTVKVTGPLGGDINCKYCITGDTAIIEISAASGITLVPKEELDPLKATTYGVGQAIANAISNGCRHFIVGLGGSATNDGGAGMLMALGYQLLDSDGNPISLGAQGLELLEEIKTEGVLPQLEQCDFRISCDVTNPLCGKRGASATYGPQKGATEEMVERLDRLLFKFSRVTQKLFPKADADFPGAGAAGGLGFAFLAFTNATLESGIDIVIEETKLADKIAKADIVITGEGRLDAQTAMGKAPLGVARVAKLMNKPVIAFAGSVTQDAKLLNDRGIDAFFPILRGICTLPEAMDKGVAYGNMRDTAEQVFRAMMISPANRQHQ